MSLLAKKSSSPSSTRVMLLSSLFSQATGCTCEGQLLSAQHRAKVPLGMKVCLSPTPGHEQVGAPAGWVLARSILYPALKPNHGATSCIPALILLPPLSTGSSRHSQALSNPLPSTVAEVWHFYCGRSLWQGCFLHVSPKKGTPLLLAGDGAGDLQGPTSASFRCF